MIIFCTKCWKDNPAGRSVCLHCGAVLETEDNTSFIDKLIQALSHPEPMTVERAAWILGELKARVAIDALISLLQTSRDMGALEKAVEALGKIGADQAVDILSMLITSSYLPVRLAAVDALGKIGGSRAHTVLAKARDNPVSPVAQKSREVMRMLEQRKKDSYAH